MMTVSSKDSVMMTVSSDDGDTTHSSVWQVHHVNRLADKTQAKYLDQQAPLLGQLFVQASLPETKPALFSIAS